VFNPLELSKFESSAHEKVMEITGGLGANMQIEAAAANPRTIPEAMQSLAIRAKAVQIGMSREHVLMDLRQFQFRAAKLSGSVGRTARVNYPRIIRLMASKKIDMTKVITKKFPLD
jgi:threonine dehydrogenase-like Zn-dependent dehydrogenase